MSIEKTIIELVGTSKVSSALNSIEISDSTEKVFLAFHRYRHGCIKFLIKNTFFADYGDGKGWQITRYKSFDELSADLQVIEYLIAPFELLRKEIEIMELKTSNDGHSPNAFQIVQDHVKAQSDAVSVRRESNIQPVEYWQGRLDSYEDVNHFIRNKTQII